jgi:hypothetical protein
VPILARFRIESARAAGARLAIAGPRRTNLAAPALCACAAAADLDGAPMHCDTFDGATSSRERYGRTPYRYSARA